MKGFNPNNGRTVPHSPEFSWLVLGVLCPFESDNELSVPVAISREVVQEEEEEEGQQMSGLGALWERLTAKGPCGFCVQPGQSEQSNQHSIRVL